MDVRSYSAMIDMQIIYFFQWFSSDRAEKRVSYFVIIYCLTTVCIF